MLPRCCLEILQIHKKSTWSDWSATWKKQKIGKSLKSRKNKAIWDSNKSKPKSEEKKLWKNEAH